MVESRLLNHALTDPAHAVLRKIAINQRLRISRRIDKQRDGIACRHSPIMRSSPSILANVGASSRVTAIRACDLERPARLGTQVVVEASAGFNVVPKTRRAEVRVSPCSASDIGGEDRREQIRTIPAEALPTLVPVRSKIADKWRTGDDQAARAAVVARIQNAERRVPNHRGEPPAPGLAESRPKHDEIIFGAETPQSHPRDS